MANLLTNVYTGSNEKKIHDAVKSAKNMNINFLPADINHSRWEFTVEDNKIRVGFCAIKALGNTAAQEIIAKQPYTSLTSFYNAVNRRVINKKIMNVLILSGCLGLDRANACVQYYQLKNEEVPDTFSPCKGIILSLKEDMKKTEKILCHENLCY
jgi:DNA polymerase-3 subunit alpha